VNDRAAGKVKGTLVAQPAAQPPDPVGQRIVDERAQSTRNSRKAENFMRSAKAPMIRAGVMMANMAWKIMKA
jgi:hypothetical protein